MNGTVLWTSTWIALYFVFGAIFAWGVMRHLDRIGENASVPEIRRKGAVVFAFLWLPIFLVAASLWIARFFCHRSAGNVPSIDAGGPGPPAGPDLEELRRKIREAEDGRDC